jgi:lysophospholipase L1-like esterase
MHQMPDFMRLASMNTNPVRSWGGTSPAGRRLLPIFAAALITASASGAVVDISGDLSLQLDTTVGSGNSARLVAPTKTIWNGTNNSVNVDLNGFDFTIDTGGGNAHTYNGAMTGPGGLVFRGNSSLANAGTRIGGTVANSPERVLVVHGEVLMNKTAGVDALAGTISVEGASSTQARIKWGANHQINDSAIITSTTSSGVTTLALGTFSDTIFELNLKATDKVDTTGGGVLTLYRLSVAGSTKGAGTYTSADGFITGSGSVVVLPPAPAPDAGNSTFAASPISVVANGVSTSTLTVTLKDSNGNPTPGKTVVPASSRGSLDTISPAWAISNASGVAIFKVKSLTVGSPSFSATATTDSVSLAQTASVTFIPNPPPDAGQSTVISSGSPVTADGGSIGSVTVTVKDSSGTPVAGKKVALSSNRGADDYIFSAVDLSGTSGTVTFTVASITPGAPAFTATVVDDSLTVTQTANLTFVAASNVVDISNVLSHALSDPTKWDDGVIINDKVPAGSSARLVGLTRTYWSSGGFARTVNLNGNELNISTGGNGFNITGVITGNGTLGLNGGGIGVLTIAGNIGNSYTGPTTVGNGPVKLSKSSGNALNGPITVNGVFSNSFPNTGTLWWGANNQVNDTSAITLAEGASLNLGGFSDTMGTLGINGNASIYLGGTTSMARFAASAGVTWASGKQLLIREWNGSSTGGGSEGVFFGNSSGGLSVDQVAHVAFMNPVGLPEGLYPAQILASGEVVPSGSPVAPINPPYDLSPEAIAARAAYYTSNGRAALTAADTPLTDGTRVVLFGDSITWQNNYISKINSAIAAGAGTQGKTITLINRGINGGGVLEIRDGASNNGYPGSSPQASFASLLASDQADIAVVYIGINDVNWRGTSIEQYEQGLRDLAATAASQGVKLVFATPAANNESPTGAGANDTKIDQFSAVVQEVANDTGAAFVDLRGVFKAYWQNHNYEIRLDGSFATLKTYGFLTYDGIHPTDLGNELIADHISAGIRAALTVSSAPSFEDWADEHAGGQTAEKDYDGDGVPNGVEFFMGQSGSSFTATPQVVKVGEVRTVTWPRDSSVEVGFKVQISEDLEDWTDIVPPHASIDESDPEQVVYTLPEGSDSLFVRLVVTPED